MLVFQSNVTPQPLRRTNDVGCQTDDLIVLCKGTQLSSNTLRSHLRSKGNYYLSLSEYVLDYKDRLIVYYY